MTLRAAVILLPGLLVLGTPAAVAAPVPPAQATLIACPATIPVAATPDHASQGWTIGSNASATFKKAEVDNAVGLTGPTLACMYGFGTDTTHEIARLTRPEPVGMLCTVNATKSAQFDCFPRPGATPATPTTPH